MDACEQLQPGHVDHLAGYRRGTTQDQMSTSRVLRVADLYQEPDENRAHERDATQVDVDGAGIAVDELSRRETERPAVAQIDVSLDLHAVDRAVRRSHDGQPHLALRVNGHTPQFSIARERPRSGREGLLCLGDSFPEVGDLVAVTNFAKFRPAGKPASCGQVVEALPSGRVLVA
jgi:hypothetical protein